MDGEKNTIQSPTGPPKVSTCLASSKTQSQPSQLSLNLHSWFPGETVAQTTSRTPPEIRTFDLPCSSGLLLAG